MAVSVHAQYPTVDQVVAKHMEAVAEYNIAHPIHDDGFDIRESITEYGPVDLNNLPQGVTQQMAQAYNALCASGSANLQLGDSYFNPARTLYLDACWYEADGLRAFGGESPYNTPNYYIAIQRYSVAKSKYISSQQGLDWGRDFYALAKADYDAAGIMLIGW